MGGILWFTSYVFYKYILFIGSDKKGGNLMTLAQKLKQLRTQTGITQVDFAIKCGFPPRQYQKYESGVQMPGTRKLYKICSVLNVPMEYLLNDNMADVDIVTLNAISNVNKVLILYNAELSEKQFGQSVVQIIGGK